MSVPFLTSRSNSLAENRSNRAVAGLMFVVALFAALFVVLAAQVSGNRGLVRSDPRLLRDVISLRTSGLTTLAKIVTDLGTGWPYFLLALAGCWYWRKRHRWMLPLAALTWMALGLILRLEVSRAIGRARPSPALRLVGASGFAFPSGHTATATIGFGLTACLLWRLTSRGWRVVIAGLSGLAATAVGLSRSYLGVHWPTDVLGGWAFGIAWVALGGLVWWLGSRQTRSGQ